jgi:predicted RND superfamily exporter protein
MGFNSRMVQRHPGAVIAIIAALTVVFSFGATRISVKSGVRDFFSETDPLGRTFDEVSEAFGGSDYIMVAVPGNEVFTVDGVALFDRVARELEQVERVAEVRSVTDMVEVAGTDLGIEVKPILEGLPREQEEVEAFRRKVLANPQSSGTLVSRDGTYLLTVVQLAQGADDGKVAEDVEACVASVAPGLTAHFAGTPTLIRAANDYLKLDLARLFPLVSAIVVAILY